MKRYNLIDCSAMYFYFKMCNENESFVTLETDMVYANPGFKRRPSACISGRSLSSCMTIIKLGLLFASINSSGSTSNTSVSSKVKKQLFSTLHVVTNQCLGI